MKNLFTCFLVSLVLAMICFAPVVEAQTVIWEENFNDEANGATTGDDDNIPTGADWTTSGSGVFEVQNNELSAENTESEAVWTSEVIDISSLNYAEINMDVYAEVNSGFLNFFLIQFRSAEDYIRCYYKLDGGPEVLFYEHLSNGIDEDAPAYLALSQVLKGSNVQIIIRAKTTLVESRSWSFFGGWSEWGPSSIDFYTIDNLTISEVPTLYAMRNGNWNNGTTWSADDYSGTQTTCHCTPTSSETVVIGNAYTVNMNSNGTTSGIRLENSGKLIYTNNRDLNISRGGNVIIETNGMIDRNGETADLIFLGDDVTNNMIVNNGTIDISYIKINGQRSRLNIAGSGTLNVNVDFLVDASESDISNSFAGVFSIGRDFFCSDANNSVFTNNAGSAVNINGNINLSNSNYTFNNSGTINQAGNFVDIDNGSSFYNLNGATWNFGGDDFDNSMSDVLSCDNGTNVFNYNGSGDQNIIIPVDAYSTLMVSVAGIKTAWNDLDINHDLNIVGSAGLDVRGNDIHLAGDWNNTSSSGNAFDEGTGSVTFDGNTQQISNASGNETFYMLEVNNNSLLLNSTVTIDNSMLFTGGIVTSTATELLVFEDNATSSPSPPVTGSFVSGPVSKIGDDTFTFPIGKNAVLAPVTITGLNNASPASQFTAEYFEAPAPNANNLPLSGLSHVSAIEYWNLDRVSSDNAQAIVELKTLDKDRSQIYDGTVEDVVVAHYNEVSNEWEALATVQGTISGNLFSVKTAGLMASFSPFAFGSSGGISPLPVRLITFNGENTLQGNRLTWQTTSETDNDFFAVERSKDGKAWKTLGEVKGNGNSSHTQGYVYLDATPFYGTSFYRLKQVDFNGEFDYSDIISVHNSSMPEPGIKLLYPNPAKGEVMLHYASSGEGELSIVITNQQGEEQIRQRYQPGERLSEIKLDLSGLSPGLYFLILRQNNTRIVEKLIKE